MSPIKFDICDGKVSNEQIFYVEEQLELRFPLAYLKCIQNCDGGTPVCSNFIYFDKDVEKFRISGFGGFIYMNESQYGDILSTYKNPPEFFPDSLVAFAENGGGDLICFDYREGKDNPDPPIVYWNHEANIGRDVSFIAKNFEEFTSLLRPDEEEAE